MKVTNSIGEAFSALSSPWGIALLAVYAFSIGILLVHQDWQGLGRGLLRLIVSLVLILITLWLTADKSVEGPRVAQPWLGLFFGVTVLGLALGLLFVGIGRFIQFKIWELEVGEAIIGKGIFVIALPLLFLWLQGQTPMTWGFNLKSWASNVRLALLLGTIWTIPFIFKSLENLRGTPWTVALLAFGIAFAYHVFQTGLPEEFFFRAYLQTHMEALLRSKWNAIILNAWLFGWLHILFYLIETQTQYYLGLAGAGLKALAYATLNEMSGGLVYAVVWAQTRSLIPIVFLHALENAVAGGMASWVARKLR